MAVIEEFKIGNATIKINDEYVIRDPEELEKYYKRISDMLYRFMAENEAKRREAELEQ